MTPKCPPNIFFCVDPYYAAETGYLPRLGDQALVGANSFIIMADTAIMKGVPATVRNVDRFMDWFDKYIIASFKN
jgi:hypothetical protein